MTTHPTTRTKEKEEEQVYTTRDDCRMCGSRKLTKILSFGETPLANAYLKPDEVGKPEPFAPLDVYHCEDCHLVQLRDVVSPHVLFDRYLYLSSTSPTFVQHFIELARKLVRKFNLSVNSLVVDVGSNDGIMLKPFLKRDIRVVGIEPAQNIADMANAEGIYTIARYFTPDVAQQVRDEKGAAAIITAHNVFAHTDSVEAFTDAVKILLAEDGVFIFEVQYLADLIAKNLFDIVYHEHVCYYHVHPLVSFFDRHGMEVFNVERIPTHGGSIRVYVQRKGGPYKKKRVVTNILSEELLLGLNTVKTYEQFSIRIEKNKKTLHGILNDIKDRGKRIVGYGAPAKATTLCYAFDITGDILEYIVDDDVKIKQGMLMPGTHIPIVPPEKLYEDEPDCCLILAWNFAQPIMKKHKRFIKQGGKFIIPVPSPTVTPDD